MRLCSRFAHNGELSKVSTCKSAFRCIPSGVWALQRQNIYVTSRSAGVALLRAGERNRGGKREGPRFGAEKFGPKRSLRSCSQPNG
jgi:hypothetical protein